MFVGSPTEGKKRENRVFVNISRSGSSFIEKHLSSFGFATVKRKKHYDDIITLSSPFPHPLEACRRPAVNDSRV